MATHLGPHPDPRPGLERAGRSGAFSALRLQKHGSLLARRAPGPAFWKLQGGLLSNPEWRPPCGATGLREGSGLHSVLSKRGSGYESPLTARSGQEAGLGWSRDPLSARPGEGAGPRAFRSGSGSAGTLGFCPVRAWPVRQPFLPPVTSRRLFCPCSLAGPAMLSLDFLDDVRRMNKRQVRLAAHCSPCPFDAATAVPRGPLGPSVRARAGRTPGLFHLFVGSVSRGSFIRPLFLAAS